MILILININLEVYRVVSENQTEYIYEVTEKQCFLEEKGMRKLYGIRIYHKEKLKFKEESEVDEISDDFEEVRKLCSVLQENDVYPIHLAEIIEDYLS